MSRDVSHLLEEDSLKADVIHLLGEFFEEGFKTDPISVRDWLANHDTSTELFVDLVRALKLAFPQGIEK